MMRIGSPGGGRRWTWEETNKVLLIHTFSNERKIHSINCLAFLHKNTIPCGQQAVLQYDIHTTPTFLHVQYESVRDHHAAFPSSDRFSKTDLSFRLVAYFCCRHYCHTEAFHYIRIIQQSFDHYALESPTSRGTKFLSRSLRKLKELTRKDVRYNTE